MMQSDAYYVQRLIEQLQTLQQKLSEAIGDDATLTQRAQGLSQKMQKLVASADDTMLQNVFEVTLLPSLDALLRDANYQLKLKQYTLHFSRPPKADTQPPPVPAYLPGPKPKYSEASRDKIEQSLFLLKNFLKE